MQPKNWSVGAATGGGLAAILLWSSTIALARSLAEQVGPLTGGAAVYLIGGALGLLRLGWSGTGFGWVKGVSRKYLLGCGSLFGLYTAWLYLAVGLARDRQVALEIGLVNYLWPAGTILFSLWLLGQRAGGLLLPGTGLALAGVFLVMTQGAPVSWQTFSAHIQQNPSAFACAFLAAIAWALYSNLTRRWGAETNAGAVELFIPATGLLLLILRWISPESGSWTLHAGVEAALLGAVTALAYALWEVAMRRGNLVLVAVASYFTPLFSTLVSCVYLKVAPHSKLWVGCLLLVAGSLLSWRSILAKPCPAEASATGAR